MEKDNCESNNTIKAKIVTVEYSSRVVHIARNTLDSGRDQLGCMMQRHQFPGRLAFPITKHKAQNHTVEFIGFDFG